MNWHSKNLRITAYLLFLSCLGPLQAQKPTDTPDADSLAIKHVVSEWSSDWNRHDAHGCSMQYVEDGDFVSTRDGSISHGWQSLEKHYATLFAGKFKNAQRTDAVANIRFITPDIASVTVHYEMMGDIEKPTRKGLSEQIMIRKNGKWAIVAFVEADYW